jgi:dextranase
MIFRKREIILMKLDIKLSTINLLVGIYTFVLVILSPAFCAAYCPGNMTNPFAAMGITNVTLGTINRNTSTNWPAATGSTGHIDNTALSTSLSRGDAHAMSYDITVPAFATFTTAVFFDWDQNGVYTDAGEQVQTSSVNNAPAINTFSFNINTSDVSTDKSRYNPGDVVTLNAFISNFSTGLSLNIEYWHLSQLISTQSVNANAASVSWTWTAPASDFYGYTIVIKLMNGTTVKSLTTTGVDVSSDWKKFPRYGFLSNYNYVSAGAQDAVLNNLNRHHINGLQFYDWQNKHHIPLPPGPATDWKAIDQSAVSYNTVENYISKAHSKNMMAMWYDLVYGALESNSNNLGSEGIQGSWYLYNTAGHTDRWNYDLSFWNGERIYFMDPANTGWQNYLFNNIDYLYKHLGFDGYHMDQIGDWGTKYDSNGNSVPYAEGFGNFIGNYLTKFPGKRAVMNAVSQYGQNFIAAQKVDFAYTECWTNNSWEKTYADLASIITNDKNWSGGKSVVLAGYMNYKNPNSNYFNDASVLRANAVIFAWGGAHIELGEHMLSNEFYPDGRMQMTDNLKNELIKYYDFLTAYENLLRDGGTLKTTALGNSNIVDWSNLTTGKIAAFNMSSPEHDVIHFLNFNGSDNLGWRDDNGSSQHAPAEQNNLNISFAVSSQVNKLYWASPDQSSID